MRDIAPLNSLQRRCFGVNLVFQDGGGNEVLIARPYFTPEVIYISFYYKFKISADTYRLGSSWGLKLSTTGGSTGSTGEMALALPFSCLTVLIKILT